MKQSVVTDEPVEKFIPVTINIVIEDAEELWGWMKIMGGTNIKYSEVIYYTLVDIAKRRGIAK